jgi:CHASE3 domain sensor protein
MIYAITGELLFAVAISLIFGSVIVSFTSTADYKYTERFEDAPKDISGNVEKVTEEDSVEDENPENFQFDHKASFLENYKSLSKEQVNGLNKDTQELMKTQQQLIDTLKNMAPVLKDGKNVLDTFKSYFGDDTMNKDLGEMLKKVKDTKL